MTEDAQCLDAWLSEQEKEKAARNDPYHPIRRSKGEKRKNRGRRR